MQPRLRNCHAPRRTNAPGPLCGVVDYWTVFSTLIQLIQEVTHESLLLSDMFGRRCLSSLAA